MEENEVLAKLPHRHCQVLLSGIQFGKFSVLWIQAGAGMTARGQKSSFCKRLK
jgi:hypothetical protein